MGHRCLPLIYLAVACNRSGVQELFPARLFERKAVRGVVKLTPRRIALICREAARGWVSHSPKTLARQWGVTDRRIRQIAQQHRETGQVPTLNPARRPKGPALTTAEKELITQARQETQRGATKIHKHLVAQGHDIPKHKIHDYCRQQKWTTPNPRKQRKRTRCRYEREHSGSLIHGDWHRTSEEHPQVIIWLDDASRKVLFAAEFPTLSGELSIATLDQALANAAQWGLIVHQVNTDRGSVFYGSERTGIQQGVTKFQLHLAELGIEHVVSRRNNPQTNGKLERLWLEYDRHRWRFDTIEEWVAWNNRQIHGALWEEIFETPDMAFIRKLPPETKLGLHARLIENLLEVPS